MIAVPHTISVRLAILGVHGIWLRLARCLCNNLGKGSSRKVANSSSDAFVKSLRLTLRIQRDIPRLVLLGNMALYLHLLSDPLGSPKLYRVLLSVSVNFPGHLDLSFVQPLVPDAFARSGLEASSRDTCAKSATVESRAFFAVEVDMTLSTPNNL